MDNITHKEFVEGYESGRFSVAVNKNTAGDFVLSNFADKHNKPAHYFWSWLGILLVLPIPIVLLYFSWIYSLVSFISGLIISSAARKSAGQFVLQNMLNNEDFFEYVLLHQGAIVTDEHGKELRSEFLTRMQSKYPFQGASNQRTEKR